MNNKSNGGDIVSKKPVVSLLRLMVQVNEILGEKPRCYLGTSFGGLVIVKRPPNTTPRYRLYPIHKYSHSNFFPLDSIVDLFNLIKECGWKITGVR